MTGALPRMLTAGESHGPVLVAVVDGFPAGIPFGAEEVERELARRQAGYGRGPRARGTVDHCRVLAGVSGGVTSGAPVAIEIPNPEPGGSPGAARAATLQATRPPVPRPGHADLALALKYGRTDFWPAAERASARETAARVAGATLARALLRELGVGIGSVVTSIGGVASDHHRRGRRANIEAADWVSLWAAAEASKVRCPEPESTKRMVQVIDAAAAAGDTLGGTFEVTAVGCPPGLGGFGAWDRRLDARLAAAVMSVPGVKAVGLGLGEELASLPGSRAHDPIVPAHGGSSDQPRRATAAGSCSNLAGGLEGGLTNGQPVVVSAAMKPIPTLGSPLPSVNLATGEPAPSPKVRSDVCAVAAAAVVAEAMVAWELALAALERFGGDSLKAVRSHAGRPSRFREVAPGWQ